MVQLDHGPDDLVELKRTCTEAEWPPGTRAMVPTLPVTIEMFDSLGNEPAAPQKMETNDKQVPVMDLPSCKQQEEPLTQQDQSGKSRCDCHAAD